MASIAPASPLPPCGLAHGRHRLAGMAEDKDEPSKADEERRAKLVKAGVAVGIGSAAIVAALLYASKVKKKPKNGS